MEAFSIGATVGPYVIEALLGRGGMGAVFRARHRGTGQIRALKVMLPSLASATSDAFVRFVREMGIAVTVDHPNVARVFDAFEHAGAWVLPMEFVEGDSLERHLSPSRGVRRALPLDEAVSLLRSLCDGVEAIHARGIIHRDLKPANVMLSAGRDGAVAPKIVDFGAARLTEDRDELTGAGLAFGTPAYMPPEQMEGRRDLDPRVDVYSLGVIAYQMLTARRPYEEDADGNIPSKVIRRAPFEPPSRYAPGLSPTIEAVVLRALALDRDQRFSSARAFSEALVLACAPEGSSTRVGIETSKTTATPTRRAWIAPAAIAVACAAVFGVAALFPSSSPHRESTAQRRSLDASRVVVAAPPSSAIRSVVALDAAVSQVVDAGIASVSVERATPEARPASRRRRRHHCRPRPGIVCPPEGL